MGWPLAFLFEALLIAKLDCVPRTNETHTQLRLLKFLAFCVSENHIDEPRKIVWLFTLSRDNSTIKHALLPVTYPHDSSGKCNYDASEVGRASLSKKR